MRSWLLLQTLLGKLTMLKRPKNLPSLGIVLILSVTMLLKMIMINWFRFRE